MSEAVAAPARPAKKRLILVIVPALLVVAGVAGYLLRPAPADAGPPPPPPEGEIVEVAQLTANLAGPELHYARVAFSVVLVDGKAAGDVQARFPLVRDAALSELAGTTPDQLRGTEGVEGLRDRLSERAVALYPDGEVLRVVLTELVVQ
jgi:flagellar protein FliL